MKPYQVILLVLLQIGVFKPAIAFPWTTKTFEECVSKEMKGRSREHIQVVQAACRKRFPALPNFVSTTYTGVLQCHGPEYPAGFTVTVRSVSVNVGALPFQLIERSPEGLRARSSPGADTGSLKSGIVLSLNFENGSARMIPVDKPDHIVFLDCKEQQP